MSVAVLLVLFVVVGAACVVTRVVISSQQHQLLVERARELNLVLSADLDAIPATLSSLGQVLEATGGSTVAFKNASSGELLSNPHNTFAWLRPSGAGFVVVAADGTALHAGQVVGGSRALTFDQALRDPVMVPTAIMGNGSARTLGFALGPPDAPAGTVLYRQEALGPLAAPRVAQTQPFHELSIALYATSRLNLAQVLVATTLKLPLTHQVQLPITAGTAHWLVSVSARQPLVGSLAAEAPWVVLGVGLFGAVLVALVVESVVRRRDTVLVMYAREHHLAETLQRSLLPTLPDIDGVEMAAQYLAGADGQEVGGDWFDVFALPGGGVAVAIGDVVGHDIAAAAAMSQLRAAVRAYAWEDHDPASVLRRLDVLVTAFSITELVSVFYAVIQPTDHDDVRRLTYANAGHLPPLLHSLDGRVQMLGEGLSTVIGAPTEGEREQASLPLDPGTSLILYTDGLVERPGSSLEDTLQALQMRISGLPVETPPVDLVAGLVDSLRGEKLRDDIALLVVRTVPRQPDGDPPALRRLTA